MKEIFTSPKSIFSIVIWIVVFGQVYQWRFFEEVNIDYSSLLPQKHVYGMIFEGIQFANSFSPILIILFAIGGINLFLYFFKSTLVTEYKTRKYKNKFIRKTVKAIISLKIEFNTNRLILLMNSNFKAKALFNVLWNLEFLTFIVSFFIVLIFKIDSFHWLTNYFFRFIIIVFATKIILITPPINSYISYDQIKVIVLPIFFLLLFSKLGTELGRDYSQLEFENNFEKLSFNYLNDSNRITTDSNLTLLIQTSDKIILRNHCKNINRIFYSSDISNLEILDDRY